MDSLLIFSEHAIDRMLDGDSMSPMCRPRSIALRPSRSTPMVPDSCWPGRRAPTPAALATIYSRPCQLRVRVSCQMSSSWLVTVAAR
jgi:hypothetical protein